MDMKKRIIFLTLFIFSLTLLSAQDEMVWNFTLEDRGNGEIELVADV